MKEQKSSLLKDIQGEKKNSGRPGAIQVALDALDEDGKKDLINALDDLSISSGAITRALLKRGIDLKPATITAYRRGERNVAF